MTTGAFHPVSCALCAVDVPAEELYPATVTAEDLQAGTFSARRCPDRVHYRLVRCRRCGLVRSDPVADPELVASLYRASSFDYEPEVPNLVRTYGRYLAKAAAGRRCPSALLEVGCGNGFMLAEARRQGFDSVTGVEPSADAVERAAPEVRPHIVCDFLRLGLFEAERFDVVCLFQVLDHLPDPRSALDLCADVLKPGGALLVLNHNVAAVSARVLGERSPIIDVEHTYLYEPRTLAALCSASGLVVEEAGPAWNWCSTGYLAQLLPLPRSLKGAVLAGLRGRPAGRVRLPLPLGNLYVIARKPASAGAG